MKTSITDLAKILDVSTATVSLALNDSPLVKKETKERVKTIASRLNYRPSEVARSLVMKQTKTVGIVSMDAFSPFYHQLDMQIQKELRGHGYLGIVFNSDNCESAVNTFIERRVDGIIASYLPAEAIVAVKNEKIPLVLNNMKPDVPVDYVIVDKYKGGYMAAEHLIKLGYRDIGFVCAVNETDGRIIAYRAALRDHRIPVRQEWIGQGHGYYRNGYEVMKKMLALPERPRAVVCLSDVAALGAMRAAGEAGLKAPDDLAIVGFDNIEESEFGYVPLTTIDQPKQEIAQKAVELFLWRLNNPLGENYKEVVVEPKLIIRDSCGWRKCQKGGR